MQRFGTLSFGHYGPLGGGRELTARDSILQAIDLAQGMDDLGVDGIYFRVHHFARQQSSPMPLLAAIAARTERIEMGTGVIDMRYENPLYLAEEAAAVDLISGGRLALGVSRGSPETVVRGYEAFGYVGEDPRGADVAREHFSTFLRAIDGEGIAERDPHSPFGGPSTGSGAGSTGSGTGSTGSGTTLQRIEPHSPGLRSRVWWGAGSRDTAAWAGRVGVNLMSSTLLTEDAGMPFDELQAEQIDLFRTAWKEAGHPGTPRTSVSRSIFPIVTRQDALYFGRPEGEGVGYIDGGRATFGRTFAAEPDVLVEQLKQDAALASADTLMLTIPSQLGVAYNLHVVETFAKHVAPALGWTGTRA
ncbi:MAG TPA: LLM class flavin-dependent oxidoreductase [Microbacterium sp.]|nr:LLM class flavin-dependent oxidoreductase [Microbacterium sp.]